MDYAAVLALIQAEIIANGNNEITANVLRPVLEAMLEQPNDLIGVLDDLETTDKTNIVAAINSILSSSILPTTALRLITLDGSDPERGEIQQIIQAVNLNIAANGQPFTVNVGEQMVFYTEEIIAIEGDTIVSERRYYRLLSGASEVASLPEFSRLDVIMPDGSSRKIVDATDTDIVVDLGNIGATAVHTAFNSDAGQPFSMDDDKFVIAIQNSEQKVWKWVGGAGNFGSSATPATASDFVDLTDQPPSSGGVPYLQAITNSDATCTLQPVNLNRTTTFTVATVITIPNSISSATAATRQQAWLSFKAASTINYPTTEGVSTLEVTAGALVYVERRNISDEWIVKKVGGTELETIRAWISPYDEDLEVEQYPGFVVTPAMTMVRAWVVCTEAPTGDDIEIDMVNRTDSNTTLASFTISANTNKSNVVTTFLDTVSEGDVIIFDCTQIGSSNAGGGLQLYLEIIKS